jgi:two-component system chemotaxis response regulator CheY
MTILSQKILLVDDESMCADIIEEALLMKGAYHIEKASNGQEGLEKYKALMPDLVIMDIEMPVMDGYESSSRIKSFDPQAKILVVTGNPQHPSARKTLDDGIALSVLQKPVRLRDLNRIIQENLSAYH